MLYPAAILRLLPENATAPVTDPRILIFHSIVGSGASAYGYFLNGTSLESTFINPRSDEPNGTRVWQLMDTQRRADANRYANGFAVSVETGDRGQPDTQPWDAGQVRRNIELGIWVCQQHPKVRRIRCTAWDGTGVGYHSMWGAPSPWTPSRGKTCPGAARILQFEREVLPAIIAEAPPGTTYLPPEDVTMLTPAQAAQLAAIKALTEQIAEVVGALPRRPTAFRMAADGDGKHKGDVWVLCPSGTYHVQRNALNLMKIARLVDEHPDPIDPGWLHSVPVIAAPTVPAPPAKAVGPR